ncbi:MAG: hypothetical protein Q4E22_00080 [Coriobacteriia bacterium]|nr:hypothetical protein [Coriobacteriia bacterium]
MKLTRRSFVAAAGASIAATALAGAVAPNEAEARMRSEKSNPDFRLAGATETTTICPYCSVGCSSICSVANGELINIEGNPDCPLNWGGTCSKGAAISSIRNIVDPASGALIQNPARLTDVLYRAPGSDHWQTVSWDFAWEKIGKKMRDVREETLVLTDEDGNPVNRASGFVWLGGAALDNEECYVSWKLGRALGVYNMEHQARI